MKPTKTNTPAISKEEVRACIGSLALIRHLLKERQETEENKEALRNIEEIVILLGTQVCKKDGEGYNEDYRDLLISTGFEDLLVE